MIKLFAIDLDGTLYNSQRQVNPRVREALATAVQNGIQPVIATGRSRRGAENALKTLEMDFPYISSAGSLLRSGLGGETIQAWPIHAHDELLHVIDFTRQYGIGLIMDTLEGIPYWFGPDSLSEIMDPLTAKEANRSIRSFEPEIDFNRPLLKVTITAGPELLAEAEKLVDAKCPSFHQVYSGIQYIDMTADGVNKGTALESLARHRNLRPEEVAAIGDQIIDLYMLRYAGLPIAMSNAVPELKQAAKWIAPSNDEDGVAWAIEEIVKINNQPNLSFRGRVATEKS